MDSMLRMIGKGVSDIHLTEEVCLRIDGEERVPGEVLDASRMESLVLPIIPAKKKRVNRNK